MEERRERIRIPDEDRSAPLLQGPARAGIPGLDGSRGAGALGLALVVTMLAFFMKHWGFPLMFRLVSRGLVPKLGNLT